MEDYSGRNFGINIIIFCDVWQCSLRQSTMSIWQYGTSTQYFQDFYMYILDVDVNP
jgi:hypothetical protein